MRDAERGERLRAALAQHVVLALEDPEAADAGADDARHAVGRTGGSSSQPAAASASSPATTASWQKRSARRTSFAREEVLGHELRAAPSPSSMPDAPAIQRSTSGPAPDAERGDGARAGDDDAAAHPARATIRSTASPTVFSSLMSSAFSSHAVVLLGDLGELDEVERVDVELLEGRVAGDGGGRGRRTRWPRSRGPRSRRGWRWRTSASFSFRSGSGGQAAVDGQGGAGHVAGGVGAEEADAGGHVLRRAQRGGRGCARRSRVEVGGHVGGDEPGATALTVTPRRATSAATVLVKAIEPGLGGGVVGLAGVGAQADDRGDVDDPPPARAQHRPQRAARGAVGGGQVRVEHAVPVVSSESWGERPSARTPALLTSTSTRP